MEIYPYIKDQRDVVEIVEAEYKLKRSKPLPSSFISRMLDARRRTILKAMALERPIKLDRLGKLLITPSTRDLMSIKAHLGNDLTRDTFMNELNHRFRKGSLFSQKYTKITGVKKAKPYGTINRFSVCKSNDTHNPESNTI
jgi:hypothetical protein